MAFLDWIKENWDLIALLVTWSGIIGVWWKRRREWRRKSFLRQVNFSINVIHDGTLELRTLMEQTARDVWINEHGVSLVVDAAERTTVEQPFLKLQSRDDQGYVLRAVLNVLSERFAENYLARAMGVDTRRQRFLFGVTCEKYGALRTQKLRVLIVTRELLDALFGENGTAESVQFEAPTHSDRLITLRVMHRLVHSADASERAMLAEVELGLPTT